MQLVRLGNALKHNPSYQITCGFAVSVFTAYQRVNLVQVAMDQKMMWRSCCLQPGGRPGMLCWRLAWCRNFSSASFCLPARPAFL